MGNVILASNPCFPQGNVTAESAFPLALGGSVRAILQPNNLGQLDGKVFRLRLGMRITGGTTTNFTPALRWNSLANTNLTTFTGDTALTAISAFAVNSVTRLWTLQADLFWDFVSQRLNGAFTTQNDGTFGAWAALSGIPITATSVAALQFLATGFFSVSNAGNAVAVTDFSLEQTD